MPNFPNELTVAYPPDFKRQDDYGTALDEADLTKAFTATAKSWSPQFNEKVFPDCTTQFMQTKRVLSRWAEMTIEFETSPHRLGGWSAFAAGSDAVSGTTTLTHAQNLILTRLLPVTTLRIGHNDGTDPGWIWKDVAVDSFVVTAEAGVDPSIRVTLGLVGSGDLVAAGSTTWPDCDDGSASTLFDGAGALTINAVDYLATLHAITLAFSNNIPRAAAFSGASVDVARWVRSRVRGYALSAQIEGIDAPGDALATLARANDGAGTIVTSTAWTFGTTGDTWTCNIPSGYLAFAGQPQGYLPEALGEIAVLNLGVQARKAIGGGATQPVNFSAVVAAAIQATAYMTPPA